jgi:hypothetical protein
MEQSTRESVICQRDAFNGTREDLQCVGCNWSQSAINSSAQHVEGLQSKRNLGTIILSVQPPRMLNLMT